jgi:hypothetical protein
MITSYSVYAVSYIDHRISGHSVTGNLSEFFKERPRMPTMLYNDLLVYEPGNQYPRPGEIAPFTSVPVWWRRFIFKVLRSREFAIYLYIAMKMDAEHAVAYPPAREIQEAMDLKSDSAVFDALRTLEDMGFLRRRTRQLPNRTSRLHRNVYQRAAPEFTLLRLLERTGPEGRLGDKGINELFDFCRCPSPPLPDPHATTEVPRDVAAGLKRLLGATYDDYAFTEDGSKREALTTVLRERLEQRLREGGEKYVNLREAPRDRQREQAREREVAIATAGGVRPTDPFGAIFPRTNAGITTADEFGDDLEDQIPF